jgi:hypothetical membrane protein
MRRDIVRPTADGCREKSYEVSKVLVTMNLDKRRLAGTLLSIGALQWFFSVMIAEGLHQGYNLTPSQWIPYSNQIHYVSELGLGSTAPIFNVSTIVLGFMVALASYLLYVGTKEIPFSSLLFICGVGATGVGLFPTNIQPVHGIFQLFALWFGAFSAILSFRKQEAPLSYISAVLGIVSFITSIVFFPYLGLGANNMSTFLGLGKGVMERIVIYPLILWVFSYGYHVAGRNSGNSLGMHK